MHYKCAPWDSRATPLPPSVRARTASPRALLLVSCSKTKRATGGRAVEVYDGPAFRTLRKAQREGAVLDVFVVSAKYGLISGGAEIAPYDQKMPTRPDSRFVERLRRDVAALLDSTRYETILVFLGPAYEEAVGELGAHSEGMRIQFATGPIGMRLHTLASWLRDQKPSRRMAA